MQTRFPEILIHHNRCLDTPLGFNSLQSLAEFFEREFMGHHPPHVHLPAFEVLHCSRKAPHFGEGPIEQCHFPSSQRGGFQA